MYKVIVKSLVALVISTQAVQAGQDGFQQVVCTPVVPKIKNTVFVKPQKIHEILTEMRSDLGDRKMDRLLGKEARESLELYSKVDEKQIYSNMYVAAAVGGAVAGAVDWAVEKYFGDGGKKLVPEDFFDVSGIPEKGLGGGGLVGGVVNPQIPKSPGYVLPPQGWVPKYEGSGPKPEDHNPYAATPAVAGAAFVGAVAYNAVKHGLKAATGDYGPRDKIDVKSFDLQN